MVGGGREAEGLLDQPKGELNGLPGYCSYLVCEVIVPCHSFVYFVAKPAEEPDRRRRCAESSFVNRKRGRYKRSILEDAKRRLGERGLFRPSRKCPQMPVPQMPVPQMPRPANARPANAPGSDAVIWTNVAKIGSEIGNPRGWLLSKQADLAERTLRTEVEAYRPKITIFVTGTNEVLDGIISRALGVSNGDWKRSEKIDREALVPNVWWTEHPPIAIWTRHPQGASARETGYWIRKIRELTRSEA
jgi:hypothetical protein